MALLAVLETDLGTNIITKEEELITDLDYSIGNPAAGPGFIFGTEPGDVLIVDILDIRVADQGVICTSEGCGPLFDDMEERTRVVKISNFPVRVPGALQIGDLHTAMGDAELCGTGIEIRGEVIVKTSVIKNFELNWPVTETATHWYVNACAHEFTESSKLASKELQRLICDAYEWDKTDAYLYMSVQSDMGINQACKPSEVEISLRFGTPKLQQFKPLIG